MSKGCGTCFFQGKHDESVGGGTVILCLFHEDQWHADSYMCDSYREYIEMPLTERARLAAESRNSIEAQKRHQENTGIAKEANKIAKSAKNAAWWAIVISAISIVISILVAIFK